MVSRNAGAIQIARAHRRFANGTQRLRQWIESSALPRPMRGDSPQWLKANKCAPSKVARGNVRYQARASLSRRLESVRDKSLQLASGQLIAKRLR